MSSQVAAELPSDMNNTITMYQELDTQMMTLWRQDTDEAAAESERIARLLLGNADLLLLFRARACIILGCATAPGYVEWAKEAVRVAKLGLDSTRRHGKATRFLLSQEHCREPTEADLELLKHCEEVLANALKEYEETEGYDEEEAERNGAPTGQGSV